MRLCLPLRMGFSWVVSALSAAALCTVAVNARNPLALPAVGESELNIIAPTVLELNRVTTKAPDPAVPSDWNFIGANFAANLPTPSEFQVTVDGNPVTVTEVGFKRRPLYAPLKKAGFANWQFTLSAPREPGWRRTQGCCQ